jgi:predicted dinucleotide-binding enzyme
MHVAVIGSGRIGATLARRLAQTGHEVTLADSRGPASLEPQQPGSSVFGVPLTFAQTTAAS